MQSALYCSNHTETETPKSLAAAGSGLASNEPTLQAGKKIGETSNCPIANYFDELQIMRYRHFCT